MLILPFLTKSNRTLSCFHREESGGPIDSTLKLFMPKTFYFRAMLWKEKNIIPRSHLPNARASLPTWFRGTGWDVGEWPYVSSKPGKHITCCILSMGPQVLWNFHGRNGCMSLQAVWTTRQLHSKWVMNNIIKGRGEVQHFPVRPIELLCYSALYPPPMPTYSMSSLFLPYFTEVSACHPPA